MALSSPQNLNYGFFRKSTAGLMHLGKREEKPVVVDVGGTGDCGFRAAAAGLLDQFLLSPRATTDWLNPILAKHFAYFPSHRSSLPGLVTSTERMQYLMKHVEMNALIPALAFTLRQLAVTEMCNHPALYRGAFVLQNEGTSPEKMRQSSTWIDESSIAALSKILALPIEVQLVDRVKTLPKRLRYNGASSASQPIVMQLQDGHYTPKVHFSELFSSVKSQPVHALHPVADHLPERSLSEILADIDAADKRVVEAFENTYHQLATMVIAGELNQDDLLKMYVKGMATSDYLSGRGDYITIEHGNQQFFDAVNRAQGHLHKGTLSTGEHHQRIIDELVHALSRAISIGQMRAEDVFSHVEKAEDSSARHRASI